MKNAQWLRLVRSREEEIREEMQNLYRRAACVAIPGEKFLEFSLIMDADGEIREAIESDSSTTDGAAWHGKAIYLAGLTGFDVWDGEIFENWIRDRLTEQELQDYEEFLKNDSATITTLEAFSPELAEKINSDILKHYEGQKAFEWAEAKFESLVEELYLRCQEDEYEELLQEA